MAQIAKTVLIVILVLVMHDGFAQEVNLNDTEMTPVQTEELSTITIFVATEIVFVTVEEDTTERLLEETEDNVTSSSNLTVYVKPSKCVSDISKIRYPLYLSCSCLSIIACLAALIIYILIRKTVLFDTTTSPDGQGTNATKHWIHFNFLISFVMRDLAFIIILSLYIDRGPLWSSNLRAKRLQEAFHVYVNNSYFYWMFVEGLWVFLGVYKTMEFTQYKHTKVKTCIVGWVTPAVLTFIWSMIQEFRHSEQANFWEPSSLVCILGPIYLIILLNLLMMVYVLYRLRILLHRDSHGSLRLAKATLALSMLLGLNLIIPVSILPLLENNLCTHQIVVLLNQVSSSFQGLFFAIFFVFTNKEIKQKLRPVRRELSQYMPIPRSMSQSSRGSRSSTSVRTNLTRISQSSNASPNGSPRISRTSRFSQSPLLYNSRGSTGSYNSPSPRGSPSANGSRSSQPSLYAKKSIGSYNGSPRASRSSSRASRPSQSILTYSTELSNGVVPHERQESQPTPTVSIIPPTPPSESHLLEESQTTQVEMTIPEESIVLQNGDSIQQPKVEKTLEEDINANDVTEPLTSSTV